MLRYLPAALLVLPLAACGDNSANGAKEAKHLAKLVTLNTSFRNVTLNFDRRGSTKHREYSGTATGPDGLQYSFSLDATRNTVYWRAALDMIELNKEEAKSLL